MDDTSWKEKLTPDIAALTAMDAVLHTDGVADMAPLPALSKEIEGTKGVRISDSRKGMEIDVYLNVCFGAKIPDTAWRIQENVKHRLEAISNAKISQVNIHIMGVRRMQDPKGNEQDQ
ncbi:MAG: Asp23/Gls24 family envelope stress response protein [Firmicutes bacterium]|nr:Asp23/Gls24 family envelope stress response protein [Bacillota bacterium]